MPDPRPIGVFDSGVGGLSVLLEIRRLLPEENFIYYADSAYCPYGLKSPPEIVSRSFNICDFLISSGSKIIVVACNTASVAGLDIYRQRYSIPLVGMEPAVKPATAATRNGRIGVLATGVTLSGNRFSSLLERYQNGSEVYSQPCPGLVELVEMGRSDSPETIDLLKKYIDPLLEKEVDTIVLGCTHYPFLKETVQSVAGPGITIIDTGEAVARQVKRVIEKHGLEGPSGQIGTETFHTSGSAGDVHPVIKKLWGGSPQVLHTPL
ncbi:MAG: glutamate racemase [Peptococcaceae bacterium BICA1-7]|nr:MAG: glutamate racemase [Peptococcaceae bacterium BICA1-7]HBV96739.1 glutamate racemase [Desulfotomaculum sp.]